MAQNMSTLQVVYEKYIYMEAFFFQLVCYGAFHDSLALVQSAGRDYEA